MAERRKKGSTATDTTQDERDEKQKGNGEQPTETGTALVVQRQELTEWTPRFAMSVDEAVALNDQKQEFMQRVLKEDFHYGKIPGAGERKVLFKAGAEALCAAMRLHPELSDAEPPVIDETGANHGGQPYWSFRRICRMYVQTGPGPDDRMLVAQAEGSCNAFEVKYRYRDSRRKCPECGMDTVRQSRPPKDDPKKKQLGFYCWNKPEKGYKGCGATFQWNDGRIVNQEVGRSLNLDVMDAANTGLKMADKRALVATTLIATGFSTDFTQDLEDRVGDDVDYEAPPLETAVAAAAPKAPATPKAPEPPKELTPEEMAQRMLRQVVTSLGNSLEPQWPKERYGEAFAAMSNSVPKVVGLLVELHDAQHGQCAHIQSIPGAVDYIYPATDEERAYVTTVKAELRGLEPTPVAAAPASDPSLDDIPF